MNQLNKSLQDSGGNVLTSFLDLKGTNNVVKGNLEMFPLLLWLQNEEGHQHALSLIGEESLL